MLSSSYYGFWDYWTLNHKVTFDGVNKKIIVNSTTTTLDIKVDVFSDWKEWVKLEDYAKYLPAIRSIGGDPTVGAETAGDLYFLINGWQIIVDLTKVRVSGVLYSDDYDTPWLDSTTLLPVYPAQVASLVTGVNLTTIPTAEENAIEVWRTQINGTVDGSYGEVVRHHAFVDDAVYVHTVDGVAGTTYPIGTVNNPVDNFTDAVSIANTNSLRKIYLMESAVIQATDDVSDFSIEGINPLKTQLNIDAGATTDRCQFVNLYLRNCAFQGHVTVRQGVVENITGFRGVMHQAMLNPGTIRLAAGSDSHFLSCYSSEPGTGTPIIDIDGKNINLGIKDYSGGVTLTNNNANNNISADFASGNLILNDTITSGTIVVRGIYGLTDNSTGTTIVQNTNLDRMESKIDIIDDVVDTILVDLGNVALVVDTLLKYQANKTLIDPNAFTMTVYDNDGITPLMIFDLQNADGVASITDIYRRIPRP